MNVESHSHDQQQPDELGAKSPVRSKVYVIIGGILVLIALITIGIIMVNHQADTPSPTEQISLVRN